MGRKLTLFRGFTLIELLAVVAIIGVLAGLSVGPIRASQARKRDSQRKIDLNIIAQGLDFYYAEKRTYPDPTGECDGVKSHEVASNPWITGVTERYVPAVAGKILPRDPLETTAEGTYFYEYTCRDGIGYTLRTRLENRNDADASFVNGVPYYAVER